MQSDGLCFWCKKDAKEMAKAYGRGASIIITLRDITSPNPLEVSTAKGIYIYTPMEFCGFQCLHAWVKEHVDRISEISNE